MFALLLLDRPRKPVGPDDDILFEWLKPTAPIAQRYLWICAELKAGQCSLPLSALLPPQSPSSWMCKVQLHEVVLMYQGSSVHHRHRQGRSRRRAAGESGMAEQRKTLFLVECACKVTEQKSPCPPASPFRRPRKSIRVVVSKRIGSGKCARQSSRWSATAMWFRGCCGTCLSPCPQKDGAKESTVAFVAASLDLQWPPRVPAWAVPFLCQ